MTIPKSITYHTQGGIGIAARSRALDYEGAIEGLIGQLDRRRGALFTSGFDYPGRYTKWDIGFVDPPLSLTARDRGFTIAALNTRGAVLLPAIEQALAGAAFLTRMVREGAGLTGEIAPAEEPASEEERSRLPSIFSVIRALSALFASDRDSHLGLYGGFGYDLVSQFEPGERIIPCTGDQRDLVLYLPDRLIVVDHARREATLRSYDFTCGEVTTKGLARTTRAQPYRMRGQSNPPSDLAPGEYPEMVEQARAAFARGDLFEVVLSQLFSAPCAEPPSVVFRRLRAGNPSPYGALINLGEGEFLVAASPEMFVRVKGRRVETCPIAGTIARGADAIEDAARVRELLNSAKDEAELTMCTDVDRNDKARICEPGSVRVIGRRQTEFYSRLIHTVDHVEGMLRPEFDALDAFLTHAWAVTVTGAPKRWAIAFIEKQERSARRWYGGAIGMLTFDGNLNTGLTLRTIRMKDGMGEVRAGATLLHDSDPEAEDAECHLKASAMMACIAAPKPMAPVIAKGEAGQGARILLVDHEDSFVHNLADYLRQTGAVVTTVRHNRARKALAMGGTDLVVLSPGPGNPRDFDVGGMIGAALGLKVPIFGVCLGLQGIAEYFGGELGQLERPCHGRSSLVEMTASRFFPADARRFTVGRYHSLHARLDRFPAELAVVGTSEDGVVMAVEHRRKPVAAVQFHPESILTAARGLGLNLLRHAVSRLIAESRVGEPVKG